MMNELKHKYGCQKTHAKLRGIEFNFTFQEWIDWWGSDIINRGCRKGQLVMARIGDQGPYSSNNVIKQECGQNTAEMRKRVKGNGSNRKGIGGGWNRGLKIKETV
jgi:hypothetical protein